MELKEALAYAGGIGKGVLITIKADGRPQSSNIMFTIGDDGRIRISVTDSRAKTANMRRDSRVSLHVTAPDFWSYAVIEGDVSLSPVAADTNDATVDELVEVYRLLGGEHKDWDEYRKTMVGDGRLIATITPTYAYGMIPSQ